VRVRLPTVHRIGLRQHDVIVAIDGLRYAIRGQRVRRQDVSRIDRRRVSTIISTIKGPSRRTRCLGLHALSEILRDVQFVVGSA
jgi:hypothetical protein